MSRTAFDLNHYTATTINIPTFYDLDFSKSITIDQIKEIRSLFETRFHKKKKRQKEKKQDAAQDVANPLREAAVAGDLEGIKTWSKGYSINARGNLNQPSILIDAVKSNASIETIRLVIQLGAFVNSVDDMHCTALHHACQMGAFDTIKLLLKSGAQNFLRDSLGRTAFHHIAAHSSSKCLALVLKYAKGADEINDGDNEGMTPLHWAVAKNHIQHLDIMLSQKFNFGLNITDIEG